MDFSIVIPTYADNERLNLCLQHLESQVTTASFEVIVVNNSFENPVELGKVYTLDLKLIEEFRTGSYAARNAGIAVAKGKILGFTDSDCKPSPDWIQTAFKHFIDHPNTFRLSGTVRLESQAPLSPPGIYQKLFDFDQENNYFLGVSVTANFFTPKESFESVGYFNNDLVSGGDFEWNQRAKDLKLDHNPSVIVYHPLKPMKTHLRSVRRNYSYEYELQKSKGNSSLLVLGSLRLLFPRKTRYKQIITRDCYKGWYLTLGLLAYEYLLRIHHFAEHWRLFFGGNPVSR